MTQQIQLRHDLAANWTSVNPLLASGELGVETDTKKIKVGDGSTVWNSLIYSIGSSTTIVNDLTTGGTLSALSAQQGVVLNGLINGKQATLVSTTNIKSINGASILGSGNLVVSAGTTTLAGATDYTTAAIATANTSIANALSAKAPSASPVFSGPVTSPGSTIVAPYTITSNQINVAAAEGILSVAANTTFTFLGTPVAGEWFAATVTNTDSNNDIFISFPTCFDMTLGLNVSTSASRLPAGATHTYLFKYTGAIYQLFGNTSTPGKTVRAVSANLTTVISDCNNEITHPASDTTGRAWTIDSNANVPAPIGTLLTFSNQHGAGIITININSDTMYFVGTGSTGSRSLAADGVAIMKKVATTVWQIGGPGVS